MPYISASIIFQLLSSVYPPLEKLSKEGEAGRKKDQRIHALCHGRHLLRPGLFWMWHITKSRAAADWAWPSTWADGSGRFNDWYYQLTSIITMTVGTVFLMWLGEQIDEYGIGNGISLIIMAGIVSRMPDAIFEPAFREGPSAPVASSRWAAADRAAMSAWKNSSC